MDVDGLCSDSFICGWTLESASPGLECLLPLAGSMTLCTLFIFFYKMEIILLLPAELLSTLKKCILSE